MHNLYSQQSDVPSALGTISPILPYPDVPPDRNSLTLIFPRPCVPSYCCCLSPVFPHPDILSPILHQPYVSSSPMSPQSCMCSFIHVFPSTLYTKPDVPLARHYLSYACSLSPVLPKPDVPSALHMVLQACVSSAKYPASRYSLSPMFPQPDIPSP